MPIKKFSDHCRSLNGQNGNVGGNSTSAILANGITKNRSSRESCTGSGYRLASVSYDETMWVWHLVSGVENEATTIALGDVLQSLAWEADGTRFALCLGSHWAIAEVGF